MKALTSNNISYLGNSSMLIRIFTGLIALTLSNFAHTNDDSENVRVHVGIVVEVSRSEIHLDQKDVSLFVGFFGDEDVLQQLDHLDVGDEVRAVFGTGKPAGESRSINKLLEIRRCTPNDQQCADDRNAEEAQHAADEVAHAARAKKRDECFDAMEETLSSDPRFVPSTISDESQSDAFLDQMNALAGEQRSCAHKIIRSHQAAVHDACERHHCGDGIGGGCDHIAGYAISDDAIRKAVLTCGKN